METARPKTMSGSRTGRRAGRKAGRRAGRQLILRSTNRRSPIPTPRSREYYVGSAATLLFTAVLATSLPARQIEADLPAPTLENLAWLAGHWSGWEGPDQLEEHWLPPKAGIMVGVHRDVFQNGRFFFEYLRIEETADGIVYYASPAGRAATAFRLRTLDSASVLFENRNHDFPQRISYRLVGDTLYVHADGVANGRRVTREWVWTRQ